MSFVQRKRKLRGISTPPRQNFRSRGGGGSIQNFGSGRVQNQFTPGNTFTGYSRGGY